MDRKIFVYQTAELEKRVTAATLALAQKFGLDAPGNTWHRDEMTRKIQELTALAFFLESLADTSPAETPRKLAKKAD
jgi:hypothetical protein